MTAVEIAPGLLFQLSGEPIRYWALEFPDGDAWTLVDEQGAMLCLSETGMGILLASRDHWDEDIDGYTVRDATPVSCSYPGDFPNAGLTYRGFILYDEEGKEVRHWLVR